MKNELQNIISGKSQVRHGDAIQAITRYLRRSKSTSDSLKSSKQIKCEEAESIKQYCNQNNFWNTERISNPIKQLNKFTIKHIWVFPSSLKRIRSRFPLRMADCCTRSHKKNTLFRSVFLI